jgi:hypothetical protein
MVCTMTQGAVGIGCIGLLPDRHEGQILPMDLRL